MKLDFSQALTELDGTTIETKVNGNDAPVPFTLAIASVHALSRFDQKDDGKVKYDCFKLALKVDAGGEVELKPEEAVLLKARIGLAFGPVIVGRCWDILNG